jgi:glycosyltransferase involved in cell wall biosynthesis
LPPRIDTAVVQGSGVDLEHFRPVPLPEGPITFLMIARLIREKGVYEFLAASRLVKRSYPKARFQLVGGLYDRLDAVKASEIRIWQEDGIGEWLGSLDDVRPAISRCSVYVLPSYHEGLPRTVMEAMAMNRAIVTTDAPGCRETVQEGRNGFLVPVGDSIALAKAMIRFMEEPGLVNLLGKESRTLAETRYDANRVAMETLRFIESTEA